MTDPRHALQVQPQPSGGLMSKDEWDVDDVLHQIQKIQQLMSKAMKDGEHYGVIPGTQKPSLLKAGAEKLCMMFRLATGYESVESYDGRHLTVKTRCTLTHITTGNAMGSGEGSCSTKESKYAYRLAKRVCPKCGAETIQKSKFPPKGQPQDKPGWYCYSKIGGCGAEFDAEDTAVTGQDVGRIVNEDVADQYNTILKMSNKRALVAAVLNVTAASDIFTQDMEDEREPPEDVTPPKAQPSPQAQPPAPATPPATPPPQPHGNEGAAEDEPLDPWWPELRTPTGNYRFPRLQQKAIERGVGPAALEDYVKVKYGVSGMLFLSRVRAGEVFADLEDNRVPTTTRAERAEAEDKPI